MKKEYITPDLDIVVLSLEDVCGDVIHASDEHGGTNSGWGFGNDDDDDFGDSGRGEILW